MTLTTQLVLGAIPAEPTRERLKICQDAGLPSGGSHVHGQDVRVRLADPDRGEPCPLTIVEAAGAC
jgi:hypothetical protein